MKANPYYFIKRGGKLEPSSQWDWERIEAIPEGSEVSCATLKLKRSVPKNRWYWKRLSVIVQATECAPTAEHLHSAIKQVLGYQQVVKTNTGYIPVADSTDFANMQEHEFNDYINKADKWMLENLGVGLKEEI